MFKQEDVNRIVQAADHRRTAMLWPMRQDHGQSILQLCVSDRNKGFLLNAEGFIPLLVDSLLLDPEHPSKNPVTVMGGGDFEAAKGPVQRVRTVCCASVICCDSDVALLCSGLSRTLLRPSHSSLCSPQGARPWCGIPP